MFKPSVGAGEGSTGVSAGKRGVTSPPPGAGNAEALGVTGIVATAEGVARGGAPKQAVNKTAIQTILPHLTNSIFKSFLSTSLSLPGLELDDQGEVGRQRLVRCGREIIIEPAGRVGSQCWQGAILGQRFTSKQGDRPV